jgi:hypothetical protein
VEGWKVSEGNLIGTLSVYNTGKTNSSIGLKYVNAVISKAIGNNNYKGVPGQSYLPGSTMTNALTPKGFSLILQVKDDGLGA